MYFYHLFRNFYLYLENYEFGSRIIKNRKNIFQSLFLIEKYFSSSLCISIDINTYHKYIKIILNLFRKIISFELWKQIFHWKSYMLKKSIFLRMHELYKGCLHNYFKKLLVKVNFSVGYIFDFEKVRYQWFLRTKNLYIFTK